MTQHGPACPPLACPGLQPTCSVMRCTAGDLLHTNSCSWLAGLMWALLMATSTPEAAWGGLQQGHGGVAGVGHVGGVGGVQGSIWSE